MLKLGAPLAIGLLCLPLLAQAAPDDFDNRIGAANLVYATPNGIKYVQSFAPAVDAALQACIPPGTNAATTLGKFIFIADVTRAGMVTAPRVRPETAVSQCFASRFAQTQLPPPPLPSYARINYPIVVEMNVTP